MAFKESCVDINNMKTVHGKKAKKISLDAFVRPLLKAEETDSLKSKMHQTL